MNAAVAPMAPEKSGSLGDRFVSTLMAFTAGFVDTSGFVALFGLFTAHVTGNFVLIGATLAQARPGILAKLLAFPVFVVVVALTQAYLMYCRRRRRDPAMPILVAQAIFLALFLCMGMTCAPFDDADAVGTVALGMLGVAAMAIQNVASRTIFSGHAPTTVMTGNVTQVVMDAVEALFGADTTAANARLRKMLPPVFGFALGAIAGGVGYVHFGFAVLGCPLLAVIAVAGWYWRTHRTG